MEDHLIHGIRHAIWHNDWSNDQHDNIVITIARMLKWQLIAQRQRPFQGRNLYALIMMGKFNLLLDGLPYDQNGQLTKVPCMSDWRRDVGEVASCLAKDLCDTLSAAERAEFESFQEEYLNMYESQLELHQNRCTQI